MIDLKMVLTFDYGRTHRQTLGVVKLLQRLKNGNAFKSSCPPTCLNVPQLNVYTYIVSDLETSFQYVKQQAALNVIFSNNNVCNMSHVQQTASVSFTICPLDG